MSTTQNETQDIATTVRAAMNGRGQGSYYDSYATPVVAALVDRETNLSERLIDYAVDAGASASEVRDYLRQIGMAVAITEAEDYDTDDEEPDNDEDTSALGRIERTLNSLATRIDGLADFARRHGYRG